MNKITRIYWIINSKLMYDCNHSISEVVASGNETSHSLKYILTSSFNGSILHIMLGSDICVKITLSARFIHY